jgi:8-oxo-dGTP pyrophosphatase MutT (NUDIX family)
MTFSALTILLIALIGVAILIGGLVLYSTANRLDRLHIRCDLTWQALDSALGRRAVVARTIGSALSDADRSRQLLALAELAEKADRIARESAENKLSRILSMVDIGSLRPQLVAELSDAEARVLIARRFYNDAVRDTLALRSRGWVRALHLGGTAAQPPYFEIAERAKQLVPSGASTDVSRTAARVVMLDEHGRVLLMRAKDQRMPGPPFWFTPGGGVEAGESVRAAAIRELYEETGKLVDSAELRGPMWRRVAVVPYNGELIRAEELFFALTLENFTPQPADLNALERASITGHRWCTADDIAGLISTGEQVYPGDLGELLGDVRTVVQMTVDPEVRAIA